MAQKVFESIYRAHRDYVYGFALRLTGFDPDAAEELTQESFYRAFVALPPFSGRLRRAHLALPDYETHFL